MVVGVAALSYVSFFTFIWMYIYCFSNNFVSLKKFLPVNSGNNLKCIRNRRNLIVSYLKCSPLWQPNELVIFHIEVSLYWRVMGTNPYQVPHSGSEPHNASCFTKQKKSYLRTHQHSVLSCVMPRIMCKGLGRGKGRNSPFSRAASVLCPAGWCMNNVGGASSHHLCWHRVCETSAEGGREGCRLWAPEDITFQQKGICQCHMFF